MITSGRFIYDASGAALSGNFRRPFVASVPVQAGAILPGIGGYGDVRVDDFRYNQILSFKAAYTQVSGSQNPEDGTYNSVMTIVVEGLNVLDMFTADRIVARLASKRLPEEEENRITTIGTDFKNVRVGGYQLDIGLATADLQDCDTHQAFQTRLCNDREFRCSLRAGLLGDSNNVPKKLQARYNRYSQSDTLPVADGITTCSLVKSMTCDCPGVVCSGNAVVVPNFGVIYVAEYRIQPHKRRLTMLRMELGSPVEADLEIGDGQSNGNVGGPA